jgi:hypothetical protein
VPVQEDPDMSRRVQVPVPHSGYSAST